MEPNYQIEGSVIVDFVKYVWAWSMNTASRTSFGKETASKYDYCCGNGHFAYQTSFDFDGSQHIFIKDQYAETVGAGILKKIFARKIFVFQQKNFEKILKIE